MRFTWRSRFGEFVKAQMMVGTAQNGFTDFGILVHRNLCDNIFVTKFFNKNSAFKKTVLQDKPCFFKQGFYEK